MGTAVLPETTQGSLTERAYRRRARLMIVSAIGDHAREWGMGDVLRCIADVCLSRGMEASDAARAAHRSDEAKSEFADAYRAWGALEHAIDSLATTAELADGAEELASAAKAAFDNEETDKPDA